MTELFMKLLNMSINAGWLVLAVLLVRIIFRKAPKWLFPLLWSFVGIRLLMPNALESRLSVIPDISGFSASEQGLLSAKGFTAPVPYVGIVWCTGMAAMLLFEALSYVHLRSKVKTAVRLSSNVYQSEHVNAPFILGLFAPRIYIPFHIKSKELDSIIAHERAHIKRRDHWLKPIAFLILSLHWFNPLIWIAYYFLCKDIELACDEYAIKDTFCRTERYLRSKMHWNRMDTRQTFCFALITDTLKSLKLCMDFTAVRSSFFSLPA